MTRPFAPQDLDCPDPDGCSVAVEKIEAHARAGTLNLVTLPASRHWFRVYAADDGFGVPNPGRGDTRFAPFDALNDGHRVPTMYLAATLEAALLETSLHDVHETRPRIVSEALLHGKLHAQVVPPYALMMVDLRDPQLEKLDLTRKSIASSSSEHYPCSRRVARAIHGSTTSPMGIVWHSRQAELNEVEQTEVAVVFADRVAHDRGAWTLSPHRTASGALLDGAGRARLDELAEALDVTIATAPDLFP